MYNIEISSKINQIIAVYYKFGMWRNDNETVSRKMGINLLCLVSYLCFPISLLKGALMSNDVEESLFLVAAAIAAIVMAVKMSYILWKKKEIIAFVHKMGVHSIKEREDFIQINKKLQIFMKIASCFVVMVFAAIIIITVSSLPGVSREKRLPYNIVFIMDWKNTEIGYWLAFAFITYESIMGFVCTLVTVLILYMMLNCSIKYEVLGNHFRNIGVNTNIKPADKKRKISEAERQNLFMLELIELIKSHKDIEETTDRFKSCFSDIFLVQIATSALGICGAIYALVFVNETKIIQKPKSSTTSQPSLFQIGFYLAELAYYTFDIFMVMFLGNEIKLSSDRVSYCLFESDWIEQSEACKKCLIILTEVLKQPQELVIFKLYPLNLETFTSILNLAYSMFNILQNLN